jgi:predicted dehydrogenase
MSRPKLARREFLKAVGAALAAPTIIPATALGRDGRAAPSERIVVGAIGTGGRGQQNVAAFLALPDVQVVAVCDVDRKHAEAAAGLADKQYGNTDCKKFGDFRELLALPDLDAVCVSTPDHWHALICVAAARAGKDIYCETPLAHSVFEGRAICDAVRDHGRVFQAGSQERSNPKVRYGCELVRRGCLGELKTIRVQLPTDQAYHDHVRKALEVPPPEMVPEGFDYERWLGPAPEAPYCSARCHFWWRFISAYGGGEVDDRGSHVIDLAQLGAKREGGGPVSIKATGQRNPSGLYDAFLTFAFTNTYDGGLQLVGESKGPRGLRFEGASGSLFIAVNGGNLEAEPKTLLDTKLEGFDPAKADAPSHHRDFIDCVKSRGAPLSDVESAQRTATICHLNNLAMVLGRELKWDPQAERIVGDEEADRMLRPAMREPWVL